MNKSLKYRLFPTKKQQRLLQEQLNECRWLYNHFLEERKTSWENDKKSISDQDFEELSMKFNLPKKYFYHIPKLPDIVENFKSGEY